jgi:hypothetical protein
MNEDRLNGRRGVAGHIGVVIVLVLLFAGTHCGFTPSTKVRTIRPVRVQTISLPRSGSLDDAVWYPRLGRIIATLYPHDAATKVSKLVTMRPDGTGYDDLRLPDAPGCRFTQQFVPVALPSGELGFLERCWGKAHFDPTRAVRLMAWNPASHRVRPLVPYFLPYGAGGYAFANSLRDGLINNGDGLYERLAWLGRKKLVLFPVRIERAGSPTWSPDGSAVALDGAYGSEGVSGIERLNLPRGIFVVSRDGSDLRQLVANLTDTAAPAWSPDGKWIADSYQPSDASNTGLWLINVATGKQLLLFRRHDLGSPTWLPDGRTLVVGTSDAAHAHLYVVHLPDLAKAAIG